MKYTEWYHDDFNVQGYFRHVHRMANPPMNTGPMSRAITKIKISLDGAEMDGSGWRGNVCCCFEAGDKSDAAAGAANGECGVLDSPAPNWCWRGAF